MAEEYTFRTVVGGFHKGDVADYIAKTAAAHLQEIKTLEDRISELEEENRALRRELEERPVIQAPVPEPEPEPEEPEEPQETLESKELTAYRRAEALERVASQRVRKLYGDMQSICQRSTNQARASEGTAQNAMNEISRQLEVIRISVAALQEGLQTSAQELEAMGELVPDPAEELEVFHE